MLRVVIVIALIATASVARADPATAEKLILEAEERGAGKDFLGAAAKFREAFEADRRPELICNVGVAYYKAKDLTRAQLYMSQCLARGSALEPKFLDAVRTRLVKFEETLRTGHFTPVDVFVEPPYASVWIELFAPGETIDGGQTVWVPFGQHRVIVRADGYVEKTVPFEAKDRATISLRITLDKVVSVPDQGPGAITPPNGSGAGSAVVVGPTQPSPRSPSAPSIVPAVVTTIATVGLAGFAIYAAGQARDHADRANLAVNDNAYQTEADGVTRWNTIFVVDVVLAGVTAIASGYLWHRALKHSAAVEVTPGGAAVSLRGRF